MSILIKIEMPKGCWACPFAVGKHYECLFTKKSTNWGLTTRPSDCPLIEVPTPHGRLIDADAYIDKHEECGWLDDITVDEFNAITPTIIEADKEQE